MKPTIGRIIHLCWSGRRIPAMITFVHNETCVNVLRLDGSNMTESSCLFVAESPESAASINGMTTPHRTWAWPPRA